MCGIVGYTGTRMAAEVLLDGLRRLEYRGYDSSGIALISRNTLRCWKAAGKLAALHAILPDKPGGHTGIGHTRWATHGKPTDENAHPHQNTEGSVAIVHNGIIENADALREQLIAQGVSLTSETDSEVLAHLIARSKASSLTERVRETLTLISGTYGLLVADSAEPRTIVAARNGSPLIVGIGEGEMFVASDVSALARYTTQVVHLDDGDIATLTENNVEIIAHDATPSARQPITIDPTTAEHERDGHAHFMLKEIHEQPAAVARTLSGRLDERFNTSHLGGLNLSARELLDVRRIKVIGCGSAYYAGICGAGIIETMARIPCDAEPAAEFRYRNAVIEHDTLYVAASQSGETFDTLAAVREIRRRGGRVLGIVNVVGSTIAREVDGGIYMHAGPEVSVASTKVYTSTTIVFALLALHLARIRDMSPQQGRSFLHALQEMPAKISDVLQMESSISDIARQYSHYRSAFYIGRASAYSSALEGAQKLKEISYIHAEAYPASELKHGPLALIDHDMPTIVIIPNDDLLDKAISSMQEVVARGGPVLAITNSHDKRIEKLASHTLTTANTHELLNPILLGIPLQLFAYHCALENECEIDQPRNLAKSVTVE